MTAPLRVALLGCGVVGSQVVRLLDEHAADLEKRIGAPLELPASRFVARRGTPTSLLNCSLPTRRRWWRATTSTSSSR
ncbi:MAG TPA: hypothetical protein VKB75_08255 [Jatrophihabitans sp.]|nr:hypothetical protein [Jatrophihabitans sp.]